MDHPAIQAGDAIFAYLVPTAFKSMEEMEATADFIVRACKAHDKLVEVLENLLAHVSACMCAGYEISDALKLARGE